MEITKENFSKELPGIIKAINDADFLSFDCEFSGIGEGSHMILPFDTPTLVYQKAKENLGTYTVVQFGLCTFRYDFERKKFLYRVFNFYVFPRVPERLSRSLRKYSASYQHFSCQADSLEFLACQEFDFNKWIYNGVGFLRKSILDYLKDEIKKKYQWQLKNEKVIPALAKVPPAHKAKLDNIVKNVDGFVSDNGQSTMLVKDLSGQEKRMLINLLENRHNTLLYFETNQDENKEFSLSIIKCSNLEEYRSHIQRKMDKDMAEMNDASGFCQVIDAISRSKKLLVGHNMYLDLLQTIKTFCCDLPENYADFKRILNSWFPNLMDTKVIASQYVLKKHVGLSNGLFELYKRIEQAPFAPIFLEPEETGYAYEENNGCQHEAGYDAFITGVCFITMSDYWGFSNNKTKRTTFDIPWDLLSPLINKISPGRIVDMVSFNVGLAADADFCPDRGHVFHLSFPPDCWNGESIQQLFAPYGMIHVAWINSESCFVSLKDRKQASFVLSNLVNVPLDADRSWKIQKGDDFLKYQEKLYEKGVLKRVDAAAASDVLGLKKMKLDCSN